MARFPARWARLRAEDPLRFHVEAILVFLFVVLVLRVVFGDNPWQDGLAERAAKGKDARPIDYWVTYGWFAMIAAAGVVGAFAATTAHWLHGDAAEHAEFAPRPSGRTRGVALVLVLGLALGLAAPRLTHGLWQDEDHTIRGYVAGAYLAEDEGLRFWGTKWRDALLYDWGPNNSIVYSLVARSFHEVSRIFDGREDERPRELVVRLPAVAFGLLSLAVVAWLGVWLGFPWAGVGAAVILALHPWHLRYTSEVRGYTLVMMLTTLGPLLLLRALEHGTWRRWCAYGVAQTALLWTYPSAVYPVAVLNAVALPMLWRLHGSPRVSATQWIRFACVNVWGGAFWLVAMAGNIPIVGEYLAMKTPRDLGWPWLQEFASQLLSGAPWRHGVALVDPVYPELQRRAFEAPLALDVWIGATCALLVLGAFRLLREVRFGAGWVAVFVLPIPIGWAVGALREDFLYTRNLIYGMPLLALLVGIGLDPLRVRAAKNPAVVAISAAVALAWLAGFVWVSGPARSALRERAFQPYRDAVAATRPLDPFAAGQTEVLTASFSGEPFYYDPFVHMIEEPRELHALISRAREENLSLFVNLGRIELARRREPELSALVEKSGLFDEVAVFHGFAPKFTQRVYRFVDRPVPGGGLEPPRP